MHFSLKPLSGLLRILVPNCKKRKKVKKTIMIYMKNCKKRAKTIIKLMFFAFLVPPLRNTGGFFAANREV